VWITIRERTSGTLDDDVLLVIYGDNGKSDELVLARGQLCQDQVASDQSEVKLLLYMHIMHHIYLAFAFSYHFSIVYCLESTNRFIWLKFSIAK